MRFAGGPAAVAALAAAAIAIALQISSGMYDARALVLVTLAVALAVAAAVWQRRGAVAESPLFAQALLGGGCAWGLATLLFTNPTFYGDARALERGVRWFAVAGLVVLSAYLCIHLRASLVRARFLLLLACFALMGIAVIRASPRPWTDVWVIQQGAAEALLHGSNPYSVTYPDIYGSLSKQWYASELLVGGRVAAFPYPPLSVLVELPFFGLFGDVRYALLASMLALAWMLAKLGGGVAGELAGLFVLFQPRTLFVLEQSWTEPLVLALFALALLASVRWKSAVLAGIAIGLVVASKQYSPVLVVPLAFGLPGEMRRKAILIAAALAAAVLLPFALWDFQGFVRGVVRMQLVQPFRPDGLSLLSLWARLTGGGSNALAIIGLLAGIAVLAVVLRRDVNAAQVALSAAAAWLAVLLLSKQSFCNHYWLCSGLLCASVAGRWASTESG
jgi:uncharacterized membrane protein